jgi:hypothetical protein
LDILIAVDAFERLEIRRRQRIFEPFATAAKRIVRQHRHNGADVVATGTPDGHRGNHGHGWAFSEKNL